MPYGNYKDLSGKKKVEHIWEYYRWHIIGTIIGVIFLGSLLTTIFGPRPPKPAVDLFISGGMMIEDERAAETEEMFRTTFDTAIFTQPCNWAEVSQQVVAANQILMVKMAAKECDVLAMSPIKFDEFMGMDELDAFAALETIPELEGIIEKYQDSLIVEVGPDGKEHVYGIQAETLSALDGIHLQEAYVVGLMATPKDMPAAIKVIQTLLE